MKIGYLGPRGTFSEEAALVYQEAAGGGSLYPCRSIAAVFEAVGSGALDQGVVPVENSMSGSVDITLDLFMQGAEVNIVGEIYITVAHCLVARPGVRLGQVKEVLSHPQALWQCREFLEGKLREARLVEVDSTAGAVLQVLNSPEPCAAVASARAAGLHELNILESCINDRQDNITRFWVIGPGMAPAAKESKTSILFSVPHRPGALCEIMQELAGPGINMTKIESRPARASAPWEYLFFLDFMGHPKDAAVAGALAAMDSKATWLKVLGAYPAAGRRPCGG